MSEEKLIAGKYQADRVNHPSHYNSGKIEVIEFIEDQDLNFSRGNAVKYVCRAGKKGGSLKKEVEDLEKAAWYIKREIELLKAKIKGEEPRRPNEMAEDQSPNLDKFVEVAKKAEKVLSEDNKVEAETMVGMDVMYHENGVAARAKYYERHWKDISFKERNDAVYVFHPSLGKVGYIVIVDSKKFHNMKCEGIFRNAYDKIRFFQHPTEKEFLKAQQLLKEGCPVRNGANNGSYKRLNGDIQLVMDK